MPRPREFDEQKAIDRALDVFWRKGYEATSMEDLLHAMGIQKGSFYNAFGSKREIYLKTLARYRELALEKGPQLVFQSGNDCLDSLEAFVHAMIEHVASSRNPQGCFFASAAMEMTANDRDVQKSVGQGFDVVTDIVAHMLEEAKRSGEIVTDADSKDVAVLFLSIGYGLQVLGRSKIDKQKLEGAGEALLGLLGNREAQRS
jgi:TetR/AcrR family transcriptional repressor of nem operon